MTTTATDTTNDETVWYCPECNYRLTQWQYYQARLDYGCPRCGAPFSWLFGGIAVLAMLLNGLLVVGAMSMIQATLTLPGVAGLILTLAMAVDANVLIYERMRDEQRAGRSPIASADAGFSRAIVTILDANITTLAAAAILFYFGSGPVRGFAWTLSIAVITSVFTAVMVTQVLTAWWLRVAKPKKLPIA